MYEMLVCVCLKCVVVIAFVHDAQPSIQDRFFSDVMPIEDNLGLGRLSLNWKIE
jgi:hypothetical protein